MHYTPTYLDVGFQEMVLAEQDGPGRWDDDYHRYLMRLGLVDRNDLEDQLPEYRQHARPEYWDTLGAMVVEPGGSPLLDHLDRRPRGGDHRGVGFAAGAIC